MPERVKRFLAEVFSQIKVLRVKDGGIYHSLFFWGFLLLFIGTLLVMAQADFTDLLWGVKFLAGTISTRVSRWCWTWPASVAIFMLAGLMVRRFVFRPKGLETVRDDYLVLPLLCAILITGFFVEGARMAATELNGLGAGTGWTPAWRSSRPSACCRPSFSSGMSEHALRAMHKALWWVHLVLALGFIAAIPYTKLRHIFTTSANAFLAPLEPKGTIATINLEDESVQQYGAAAIADLTWKDIFDADACTACKRCQDRCPAYATEKPLSPMKIVQQIGELAEGNPAGNLIETCTQDALWACTTCRACQDVCPADIEHVNKILEMRRNLASWKAPFRATKSAPPSAISRSTAIPSAWASPPAASGPTVSASPPWRAAKRWTSSTSSVATPLSTNEPAGRHDWRVGLRAPFPKLIQPFWAERQRARAGPGVPVPYRSW